MPELFYRRNEFIIIFGSLFSPFLCVFGSQRLRVFKVNRKIGILQNKTLGAKPFYIDSKTREHIVTFVVKNYDYFSLFRVQNIILYHQRHILIIR